MPPAVTTQELLAHYGPEIGLSANLAPWPRELPLADTLASAAPLMAPMAGVSDAAYRLMARAGGAALAYSEMVSVAGICFGSPKTWELAVPDAAEPDLAVQLFGKDPAQFGQAAHQIQDVLGEKLALIDINMACPVPKVQRKGEGSALLADPARAAEIVAATVAAVDVPVTAKLRIGRRTGDELAFEVAQAVEQAGASAIAIHGRFASQLYRGTSNDEAVAAMAACVKVPVIASGDMLSAEQVAAARTSLGVANVFVARGSYGNPWIFKDALALSAGHTPKTIGSRERLHAFKLHVRLLEAAGAHLARARSLAGWYVRGVPFATVWRERAMHAKTAADYCALADAIEAELDRAEVEDTLEPQL